MLIVDQVASFKDFKKMGFVNTEVYGIKGDNGICIASKYRIDSVNKQIFYKKDDARHINVEFIYKKKKINIHNFYVPAGGDEPDPKVNEKFKQKLKFLDEATKLFYDKKSKNKDYVILVGDLNIAPHENDVWSHKQLKNVVSHTEIERAKLLDILESGNFIDTLKKLIPSSENLFTWWSYRSPDFRLNNRGRRLDHIWINKKSSLKLIKAKIIKEYRELEKPSDHVPVVLELSF